MNEAETRAELIDPKIKEAGWGDVEGSFVRREFKITNGEIKPGGIRAGIIRADYVLIYKNRKLAVIEAKSDELNVSEGVSQAKEYAQKLKKIQMEIDNLKGMYLKKINNLEFLNNSIARSLINNKTNKAA